MRYFLLLACLALIWVYSTACDKSGADPSIECCVGGYRFSPGDSVLVNGQQVPIRLIVYPVFTPNGDGKNDSYRPDSVAGISNYSLEVRGNKNRVMFSTGDLNAGWNGNIQNFPSSEGGYRVRIRFRDATNRNIDTTTSICLVRGRCVTTECIDKMSAAQGYTDPVLRACQ